VRWVGGGNVGGEFRGGGGSGLGRTNRGKRWRGSKKKWEKGRLFLRSLASEAEESRREDSHITKKGSTSEV